MDAWRWHYAKQPRAEARRTVERLIKLGLIGSGPLDLVCAVSRCEAMLRRMRSVHRVQVTRDYLPSGRYGEWIDLGGEG